MDPAPEALRGAVRAMWDCELADGLARLAATPCVLVRAVVAELRAEPMLQEPGFLTRLAMRELPMEERQAFFTACRRHSDGRLLAGIPDLPSTAELRKVLFPKLTARFGEKPTASSRMEFLMIVARAPVPMRLSMDTAARAQGLRWSVQVVRLPEQRTRYQANHATLLGLDGITGWDRLRADSLEAHSDLLVDRIAETVDALSTIDWDAAGR